MKKYLLAPVTLALLLLICSPCLASFNQLYWQYYKDLPVKRSGFSAIRLDQDVMRHCQENFFDLRVTNQEGQEISSQVIQPGKEEIDISVTELDRIEYPAYTSLVLDFGPNASAHNRINLDMNSYKDYMLEVTLEASQDNKNWGKIGSGRIMVFRGDRYNTVNYTTSTTRYLRVNIKQIPGEKRLGLSSYRVYFVPASLYEGKVIPAKILSQRSDRTKTNIILDLKAPNYFVNRVVIKTPDRNFDRQVQVTSDSRMSSSNRQLFLNTERIFSYQWQNYSSVKGYIDINQYGRRYLFLAIENGNSPPLNINDIKVIASPPYLLADLQGPARLWYGNANIKVENYDLSKFSNLIQLTNLQWVTPGVQQINPDYKVPWTEQHKWLLDTLIILVAAAFVFFILRNFNKMRDKAEKS